MKNYLRIFEIAKKFKCSDSTVRRIIYKLKLVSYIKEKNFVYIEEEEFRQKYNSIKHSTHYTEDEKLKWLKDFNNGNSISTISKKYKRDQKYISSYLRNVHGIDTREYHKRRNPIEKIRLEEMRSYYLADNKVSILDTLKHFNYTNTQSFVNYLKRCGEQIKSISDINSFVKHPNFFKNIDSEIKAYLLGFFAADGHIEKNSGAIRINVKLDDCHILMLYNKYICDNRANIKCKNNVATLTFQHKELAKDIYSYGYDNHKTYTCKSLPQISEEMYSHFIRGYFDGDGSIMINRRRHKDKLSGYNRIFSMAAYNKEILLSIVEKIKVESYSIVFNEKYDFQIRDSSVEHASSYTLTVYNLTELNKIYNYLYKNSSFFFKRKKDKFDLAILDCDKIDGALQGNL